MMNGHSHVSVQLRSFAGAGVQLSLALSSVALQKVADKAQIGSATSGASGLRSAYPEGGYSMFTRPIDHVDSGYAVIRAGEHETTHPRGRAAVGAEAPDVA